MDDNIDKVTEISETLQERIYKLILSRFLDFDIIDGKLVPNQDYRRRILNIENRINEILGQVNYSEAVAVFLNSFEEIQDRNVLFQSIFSDLEVGKSYLTPARLLLYEQAQYQLTKALSNEYVQPVKMLLMQQIVAGATIEESQTLLRNWNEQGVLKNGVKAPNLHQYNTQICRDSAYGVHRNINNIIKDKFGLDRFIYVGGVIEDSRPLCKHLVALNRPIELDEMPPLISQYPDGLYPNTVRKNFMQVCGGYNCRHQAVAIR